MGQNESVPANHFYHKNEIKIEPESERNTEPEITEQSIEDTDEEVRFEDESESKSEVGMEYCSPSASVPESIPTPQVALDQKFTDLSPSPTPVWIPRNNSNVHKLKTNLGRESSVGPDGFGKVHKPGRIGLVYSADMMSPPGNTIGGKKVGFQPPPRLPVVGGSGKISSCEEITALIQNGVQFPSKKLAERRNQTVNSLLCTRPCNRFTQDVVMNEIASRTVINLEEVSSRASLSQLYDCDVVKSKIVQPAAIEKALAALKTYIDDSSSDSDD